MVLFLFMLVLGIILVVLVLSNLDAAPFGFFRWSLQVPKGLVIIFGLLSGAFFTFIWQSLQTISSMRIYREFSRKITSLEEELKKKDQLLQSLQAGGKNESPAGGAGGDEKGAARQDPAREGPVKKA
jgi:uncharacterized integral membrane protein